MNLNSDIDNKELNLVTKEQHSCGKDPTCTTTHESNNLNMELEIDKERIVIWEDPIYQSKKYLTNKPGNTARKSTTNGSLFDKIKQQKISQTNDEKKTKQASEKNFCGTECNVSFFNPEIQKRKHTKENHDAESSQFVQNNIHDIEILGTSHRSQEKKAKFQESLNYLCLDFEAERGEPF